MEFKTKKPRFLAICLTCQQPFSSSALVDTVINERFASVQQLAEIESVSRQCVHAVVKAKTTWRGRKLELSPGDRCRACERLAAAWMVVTDLDGEEWRQIEERTKSPYFISNRGRVKRLMSTGEKLVEVQHPRGDYSRLNVFVIDDDADQPRAVTLGVHRLVGRAFLSDWDPTKQIEHRDDDRSNNDVRNLKVATPAQNTASAIRNKRHYVTNGKTPVVAISPAGERRIFKSMRQADLALGFWPGAVCRVISGFVDQCRGYRFERLNGEVAA